MSLLFLALGVASGAIVCRLATTHLEAIMSRVHLTRLWPTSWREWEAIAARGPLTQPTVDHGSMGDNWIFHVKVRQGKVEVEGSVVRGAVTLKGAYTEEEDTHLAPVRVPGNRHYTLHPVRLSQKERDEAILPIYQRWETFNRNTLGEWMAHHVEHGYTSRGEASFSFNGWQMATLTCGCGERFHGEYGPFESPTHVPEGFFAALGRADLAKKATPRTSLQ